jgi:hypothetical protein
MTASKPVTFEAPAGIGQTAGRSLKAVLPEKGWVMKRTGFSFPRKSDFATNGAGDDDRRGNVDTRNKLRMTALSCALVIAFAMQMMPVWMDRADAASDLTLAPNLSFDDDSSPNFPIQGKQLSEGSKASGEATVIFFGTANCWNTAREAERLIRLYPQFRNRIHFVIVDLHHVAPEQEALVSHYYHGYIPTITAIDSRGQVIYDRAGETAATRGDTSNLQTLLESIH